MFSKFSPKTIAVGVLALALAAAAIVYQSWGCTSIGDLSPEMGSQGYRVWTSDTIKTFTHRGEDICVPEGWLAVGALSEGEGTAQFAPEKTGVLIKRDAFGLRTLEPAYSSYLVTVLYPLSMPRPEVDETFKVIQGAFSQVGSLYETTLAQKRLPHTVLVTTGIAEDASVYPDPGPALTTLFFPARSERGEALLIHAVVHLYNRFGTNLEYQALQWPFNADEFQELEATWAETALTTHPGAAFERLLYLYKVHNAVVTQKPELVDEPPFTDTEAFKKIVPTILVKPGSPYLDYQYGHYVLAPLTMAAIDALLFERGTGLTVRQILKEIHAGKRASFMDSVAGVLSDKDMKTINAWIIADAQIPIALIQKAIALYDQ